MGFFDSLGRGFFEAAGQELDRERDLKTVRDEKRAELMMKNDMTKELESFKTQELTKQKQFQRGQQVKAIKRMMLSPEQEAKYIAGVEAGMDVKDIQSADLAERKFGLSELELQEKIKLGTFDPSKKKSLVNVSTGQAGAAPKDAFSEVEEFIDPIADVEAEVGDQVVFGDVKPMETDMAISAGQTLYDAYKKPAGKDGNLPMILPAKPTITDYQKAHGSYGTMLLEIDSAMEAVERSLGPWAAGEGAVRQAMEFVTDVASMGTSGTDPILKQRGEDIARINTVFNAAIQIGNAGDSRASDKDMERLKTIAPLIAGKGDELQLSKSKVLGQLKLLKDIATGRYLQTGKVLANNNVAADFLKISKGIKKDAIKERSQAKPDRLEGVRDRTDSKVATDTTPDADDYDAYVSQFNQTGDKKSLLMNLRDYQQKHGKSPEVS